MVRLCSLSALALGVLVQCYALPLNLMEDGADDELSLLQRQQQLHRHRVPSCTVNLDLPPEQRWFNCYRQGRERYLPLLAAATPLESLQQREFLQNVNLEGEEEILGEYRGIVAAMNDSRVTVQGLLWSELGYERGISMGCTGVVAATPNGTVFHGRNLDLTAGQLLVHLLVEVTFTRGGVPLMSATNFAGNVGVHTGHRFSGGWSVAQNTRDGCDDIDSNAKAAAEGGRPFMLFLRHLMEEVPDFETAVQQIAKAKLIAPQYFTVAGPGAFEGALVTRDREGNEAPYGNVLTLSPAIGRWYIVQTNDDVWHPAADARRPTALSGLEGMQPEEMSAKSMSSIMMMVPVLNPTTVFTWVYCPLTGYRKMLLGYEELGTVLARAIKPLLGPLTKS